MVDSFKHSMEIAKAKTNLTIDDFRVTRLMLPPIPTPRIIRIDEGSPMQVDDGLPPQELILQILEVTVTRAAHQLIQVTPRAPIKDKRK